jgi:uncharacterized membrane protein
MASSAYSQYLQVDSSIIFYFLLVLITKGADFFFRELSIRDVNVFCRYINMVEQVDSHVVVIAFSIVLQNGIILVKIECNYIFKR